MVPRNQTSKIYPDFGSDRKYRIDIARSRSDFRPFSLPRVAIPPSVRNSYVRNKNDSRTSERARARPMICLRHGSALLTCYRFGRPIGWLASLLADVVVLRRTCFIFMTRAALMRREDTRAYIRLVRAQRCSRHTRCEVS